MLKLLKKLLNKKKTPLNIEKEMKEGRMTNCANYWNAKYENEKYLAKLN